MRQANNKFSFLNFRQWLAKWAKLEIGHAPTTECDFDPQPGVIGYKDPSTGDVFYCCERHHQQVEAQRA